MKILGINFECHDSGAAIVVDGKIEAAVNEERFTRKKMDNTVPANSIKYCLEYKGLNSKDIDLVILSGFSGLKKFLRFGSCYRKEMLFARFRGFLFFMYSFQGDFYFKKGVKAIILNIIAMTGIPSFFIYIWRFYKIKRILRGYKGKFLWVDHHIGHMASAYLTSGYKDCLSVVIEGLDWENSMVIEDICCGNIEKICATPWPHSAGVFYELVTLLLGFNPYIHSGKVTGLAAYGEARKLWDKVSQLMWVEGLELRVSPLIFSLRSGYIKTKRMPSFFDCCSKEDLAAAFQERLEICILEIIEKVLKKTGDRNVVLSGGVCANVRLNQRILELDGVKNLYVHPGMSDVGQALGVALWGSYRYKDLNEPVKISNVFLGPEFSDDEIEKILISKAVPYKKSENIQCSVAKLLAQQYVVAVFNGRMEYGPRALGNRSILCHTADSSVNDWLNKRLKRTEFMPFAPASLIEETEKLYVNTKGAEYTAKFMTTTFKCTGWMKLKCPAVVHIDGTARPQFVDSKDNPDLYMIIKEYYKMTGIPVILNTSFNIHGEPIVVTPDDALNSFLKSGIDYLVIGSFVVSRLDLILIV